MDAMAAEVEFIVTPKAGVAVTVKSLESFFCDHPVEVGEFPIAKPLNLFAFVICCNVLEASLTNSMEPNQTSPIGAV